MWLTTRTWGAQAFKSVLKLTESLHWMGLPALTVEYYEPTYMTGTSVGLNPPTFGRQVCDLTHLATASGLIDTLIEFQTLPGHAPTKQNKTPGAPQIIYPISKMV